MKILIVAIFIISGCATKYGKQGLRGGFSEMKLSSNAYQVTFHGNGLTSSQTVEMYMMRRSAELTLVNGFKYFTFADRSNKSQSFTLGTKHNGRISKNYDGSYNYKGNTQTTKGTRHSSTSIVLMTNKKSSRTFQIDAEMFLKENGFEEPSRGTASESTTPLGCKGVGKMLNNLFTSIGVKKDDCLDKK